MKSTRLSWTLAWWLSAAALPVVAVQGKKLRKTVLGIRSRLLDRLLLDAVSSAADVDYLAVQFPTQPDYVAIDGFHPSALGYDQWAAQIARNISEHLADNRTTRR